MNKNELEIANERLAAALDIALTGLDDWVVTYASDHCDRSWYHVTDLLPGFGFFMSTYAGDGKPLPPFEGDPQVMPLVGGINHILNTYWEASNEANRVAIVVKFIHLRTALSKVRIINGHQMRTA